jgi:hypothetical protein
MARRSFFARRPHTLINSVSQLRLQAANELGETDLPLALEALGRED